MFRIILRMLSVVWIILIAASAVAQDKGFKIKDRYQVEGGGKKWALIIGINSYQDQAISDLQYAVNDAEKLYQLLIDPNYGGFEESKVILITDDSDKKPTRENILIALNGLENVSQQDSIFIFFSGHGMEERGVSYFLPSTAKIAILADSAISMERFQQPMDRTQAKVQVLFFDACHSGANTENKAVGSMGEQMYSQIYKRARGRAILSSCGKGELSYEYKEKENGVFTYFLLEALRGSADENGNGMVSVSEASDYTSERVMEWGVRNGKKQNPQKSETVTGQIILTVNREGERLAKIQAQRQQVESELAEIQRRLSQARQSDDSVSEAAAKQQAAELAEKVRQAKLAEETERIREEEAARQREEEARQQELQTIRDAESREQARQEQAEIERKQQQLEADRQRLQAQQVESMTLNQVLAKAKEIQSQINSVRPQVRAEIRSQIAQIPKPQKSEVSPKDQFETQAMYQQRVVESWKKDQAAQQRYNQEVLRIEGTLTEEVKARSEGYKEALVLLNRDLVLDETQVELNLGPYDAEKQVFPEARLSVRDQSVILAYSWPLYVPLQQAKSLNSAVNNRTVKIRVNVSLDAKSKKVKIDKGSIEDLVQEAEFGFPNPSLKVDSTPSGASVLLDGVEFGLTPFAGEVPPGQHEVSVSVEGLKNLPASKSVSLDYGGSQRVSFRLNVREGFEISNGRVGRKGMVLIPAGSFEMGSNDGQYTENPVHTVYVDAFYMDKYEVTNAQYRKFMQATGRGKPGYWNDSKYNQPSQPVVGVSWDDATAYAEWAGKWLPTEAEWEYAARGGLEGNKYPWGNTIDSRKARYNQDYSTGKPVSVGSYSANGYGLYDMAGNVWEWCADWYDEDYYSSSPSSNPQGPSTGEWRVLRGGSWYGNSSYLRVAFRGVISPAFTLDCNGFRCVSGF